jgi:hypothetical protein
MNGRRRLQTMIVLPAVLAALAALAVAVPAAGAGPLSAGAVVTATDVAAHYDAAGGTAACATARRAGSSYPRGLRLVNGCAAAEGDVAIARYTFTLPAAPSYSTITLQVIGTSIHVPLQLTAAFHNGDGTLELPGTRTINGRAHIWRTIASVPAAGHLDGRHVYADVLLDATFGGVNDFDLDRVRLQVTVAG